MKTTLRTSLMLLLGWFTFGTAVAQDCPAGQAAFELRVHTDAWGYELYWELTPGGDACGDNTLYAGGNAAEVGCDENGIDGAPAGSYASNSSFHLDTLCGTPGELLTLHHVDSYGDGGTYFEVYVDGVLHHSFQGTGDGNVWTFDPFALYGPVYDSPCGAVEVEVDGPMVVVSNDSCTAAYGEPGAPNFPGVYSCQINGGWCEGGVSGSAWLSFTATGDPLYVSACTDSTDFDTQLALWKAEDCSDFTTYTLISSNDDLPGGCGPGAYYASAMWTGCLDSGATYLIQLDGWQDARGQAGITIETSADAAEFNAVTGGLSCPLGKEEDPNGTIVLNPLGTGSDFTAAWIGPNNFSAEGQQIAGLSAGTYSAVIATNCGTNLTYSVTLTEPAPLTLDLDLVPPGCPDQPNGSAALAVEGGSEPYTITWSGSEGEIGTGAVVEGLAEGSFTVTMVDDNGCSEQIAFNLEAEDDAFAFSLGGDTVICDDQSLVLSAPAGLEYIWSNGSVDQFIIVDGSELGPGTYPFTVEASNAFGCSHADAIFVTVYDCTTGIGEQEAAAFSAFPNPAPANGSWIIEWNSLPRGWEGGWTLRDVRGRQVGGGTVPADAEGRLTVDAEGLDAGRYLWTANGTAWTLDLLVH